jgi:Zn-dependent peptidase ImmA (M78 family)
MRGFCIPQTLLWVGNTFAYELTPLELSFRRFRIRLLFLEIIVKTTPEIVQFLSYISDKITCHTINNWRKERYISPDVRQRKGREPYSYSEKYFLIMKIAAISIYRNGLQVKRAFETAETQYNEIAGDIYSVIREYYDNNDYSPGIDLMRRLLGRPITDLENYLTSLIEENYLRPNTLVPINPYTPNTPNLLARTPHIRPAYKMLDTKTKITLRDDALELFRSQTKSLPVESRIPAPVEMVEREFNPEYRVLARNHLGHINVSVKQIFLSLELRNQPKVRRLVLMHEYFHWYLKHIEKRECTVWTDDDITEAEATYAAVYYLVPLNTFDLFVSPIVKKTFPEQWIERISDTYEVSNDVIQHYLDEHPELLEQMWYWYAEQLLPQMNTEERRGYLQRAEAIIPDLTKQIVGTEKRVYDEMLRSTAAKILAKDLRNQSSGIKIMIDMHTTRHT